MKRGKIIKIICFTTLPFIILVLLRVLKVYEFYRIPTTNMEPAYSIGDIVFSSNIPTIKRGDIVVYLADPLERDQTDKPYFSICRLVGMPNDTIQIINGLLFTNNKMSDDTNKLCYNFIIENPYRKNLFTAYQKEHKVYPAYFSNGDSLILNFTYKEISELDLGYIPKKWPDTMSHFSSERFNIFPEKIWNGINFGPVIVPPNSYFIMGDNRAASADSRIRGFIPKEKLVGKILN